MATEIKTAQKAVAVKKLRVSYGGTSVLKELNLEVRGQTLTVLTAPNGSGKTTLFRAILGLVDYDGEIRIFGKTVNRKANGVAAPAIGYVPQRAQVKWDMPLSALDVVVMGLYPKIGRFRFVRRSHRTEAMEYLALMGLEHKAHAAVGNLSGGEQQRVMLARALALKPGLYLADEPFNNVDKNTEKLLIEHFITLKKLGCTIFCIDHAPERFATDGIQAADRIITL